MKYNHALTIAFEVISKHPKGEDITPQQMRDAIIARLASIDDKELMEATMPPYDTYEMDDEPQISLHRQND